MNRKRKERFTVCELFFLKGVPMSNPKPIHSMKHFFTLIAAAMTFMVSGWSQTNTVVDVIVNSPDHNTLETAVLAAGLEGDLSGTGPFTVFAPTDSAFAAVDSATLAGILADDALLTAVLTYHVHGGEAFAGGLMDQMMVSTLNGRIPLQGIRFVVFVGVHSE